MGHGSRRFPLNCGVQWSDTVGSTLWEGGVSRCRPGFRPWSCEDCAGCPGGSNGAGRPRTPWLECGRAYQKVRGTRGGPGPLPQWEAVRMVGVGRKLTGAVPSLSCPASPVPKCCYSIRDGGAVTEVSGWDPGHIHCGSSGLTPPVLGAVAEWLAFNAFVRRAVGRWGRLSLVPRDGLERGGDVPRSRESRGEPSSEAEIVSRVRGGCEWAARWTSLSPFLSSGWEAGRGPLWA